MSKKSFTIKRKIEVVESLNSSSLHQVAKRFNIDRSVIRRWRDQIDELNESDPKKRRLCGAGRSLTDESFDNILAETIRFKRINGDRVSRADIIRMAKSLFEELHPEQVPLLFSIGWLEKFMSRNNFSLRRITSKYSIQRPLIIQRAVSFRNYIEEYLLNISRDRIFAFDETAIQPCSPLNVTVNDIGTNYVAIKASNLDKFRITLIVGFNANGSRMKPCFLQQSLAQVPTLVPDKNYFSIKCKNAWISDEVMKIYLNYIFPFRLSEERYLVMDSARPHISVSTKNLLQRKNIKIIVIPGGITGLVQPADVFWIKKIKSFAQPHIDGWISNPDPDMTASGNRRPPKLDVYAPWFTAAFDLLSPDYIQLSFDKCFLSPDVNALHIANHEAFGDDFLRTYLSLNKIVEENEFINEITDIDEVLEDLDDLDLEAEEKK